MITITYFGNLKDKLNREQEEFAWERGSTEELLEELRQRGEIWAEALAPENVFRVVVNEEISFAPVEVNAGDRVALLPPVTGG